MTAVWMLVLPLMLWFVEQVLPYPVAVEETAKLLAIYYLYKSKQWIGWQSAFNLGLIFGLSETALFLVNANILLNLSMIWWRILLTVPMHGITTATLVVFGKHYWWLGLIGAMTVHGLFNLLV